MYWAIDIRIGRERLTFERMFDIIWQDGETILPRIGARQVNGSHQGTDQQLICDIDAAHGLVSGAQQRLFSLIAEVDRREAWRGAGARDMAHWLWMRYGISDWKARRWIAAACALSDLPRISQAFRSGELGIDKVVELTRFAKPETEADLIRWARHVSCWAIRRKGDLSARASAQELVDADRDRSLSWWFFDEGRRFGLEAELPAEQGAVIAKALDSLAETIPAMPGEQDSSCARARRADALMSLCSARIASEADQDRATVVVHARLEGLAKDAVGGEIEGGPVIHHATLSRLLCNARVQTVVEDASGAVIGLGRLSRDPSPWMERQVRYRDQECRFPGCGARRFTQVHHIVFWRDGGRTDLDNLLLICSFHHKLVHEYGWRVSRDSEGTVRWFHPDGRRYRAGPSPGNENLPKTTGATRADAHRGQRSAFRAIATSPAPGGASRAPRSRVRASARRGPSRPLQGRRGPGNAWWPQRSLARAAPGPRT